METVKGKSPVTALITSVAVSTIEIVNGKSQGRDPRSMTQTELIEAGHTKAGFYEIVRRKCVWCQNNKSHAVRKCVTVACPLWPYRMGTNPFTKRTGNPNFKKKSQ
jgi:hypothetical protein